MLTYNVIVQLQKHYLCSNLVHLSKKGNAMANKTSKNKNNERGFGQIVNGEYPNQKKAEILSQIIKSVVGGIIGILLTILFFVVIIYILMKADTYDFAQGSQMFNSVLTIVGSILGTILGYFLGREKESHSK